MNLFIVGEKVCINNENQSTIKDVYTIQRIIIAQEGILIKVDKKENSWYDSKGFRYATKEEIKMDQLKNVFNKK